MCGILTTKWSPIPECTGKLTLAGRFRFNNDNSAYSLEARAERRESFTWPKNTTMTMMTKGFTTVFAKMCNYMWCMRKALFYNSRFVVATTDGDGKSDLFCCLIGFRAILPHIKKITSLITCTNDRAIIINCCQLWYNDILTLKILGCEGCESLAHSN